jgi:hypothetical protein
MWILYVALENIKNLVIRANTPKKVYIKKRFLRSKFRPFFVF